jgi:arylsulfatase
MNSRPNCCKFALRSLIFSGLLLAIGSALANGQAPTAQRPNIVMLMTDDTGWGDFGAYGGGGSLGHPTPNVDRVAKEGAVFTSWYGQASCTAGRASFMTGRIPIRSALSVVVVPADDKGHTDDCRILPEKRLLHLLLRQMAYGGSAQILSHRTRLR